MKDKYMGVQRKRHPGQSGAADGNNELRTIEIKIRLSPSEDKELKNEWGKSSEPKAAVYYREKLKSKSIRVVDNRTLDAELAQKMLQLSRETGIPQTSKLGNNLNQIARRLNGREPVTFREMMNDMAKELELMREKNKKLDRVILKGLRGES